MKITIRYMLHGEDSERTLSLQPEEYFDPLDDDESYLKDGCASRAFDHEYLDVPTKSLKYLISILEEGTKNHIVRAQYLDGDDVLMQHVKDFDESEELIVSKTEGSGMIHIARIKKPAGSNWSLVYNSLASDVFEDGKYATEDLIKNWSKDELERFSSL